MDELDYCSMVVAFYRTPDRPLEFGGQPIPVVGAEDVRPVQERPAAVGKTPLPSISDHWQSLSDRHRSPAARLQE